MRALTIHLLIGLPASSGRFMQQPELIQIAYADDHDIVRKGICELLNSLGSCQVAIEASNGQDLIDQLAKGVPKIDICILDIFMPVLNGFDTLVEIRKRWPKMRVLILTGHNTDFYLIKMIMAGANGFLLKNCSPKELEAALVAIHDHGIYHSDIMSSKYFRAVVKGEIKLPKLTENETTFMKYCCSDFSYVQIAEKMGVSPKSVDWYRESLFKKLNVGSRSGLVMTAIQFGLVSVDTSSNFMS